MSSLETVLLVVQLIIAIALICVILLQRTAQDGGGLVGGGGSTMGGLFTARGSANVLTRITSILATLFILNSLGLELSREPVASYSECDRSIYATGRDPSGPSCT